MEIDDTRGLVFTKRSKEVKIRFPPVVRNSLRRKCFGLLDAIQRREHFDILLGREKGKSYRFATTTDDGGGDDYVVSLFEMAAQKTSNQIQFCARHWQHILEQRIEDQHDYDEETVAVDLTFDDKQRNWLLKHIVFLEAEAETLELLRQRQCEEEVNKSLLSIGGRALAESAIKRVLTWKVKTIFLISAMQEFSGLNCGDLMKTVDNFKPNLERIAEEFIAQQRRCAPDCKERLLLLRDDEEEMLLKVFTPVIKNVRNFLRFPHDDCIIGKEEETQQLMIDEDDDDDEDAQQFE
jgi:hypothetical protein